MNGQTIAEVTVFCRKPGEGRLVHQRPGQIKDGVFIHGEKFDIGPNESKRLPVDVADALRKHFPTFVLTDEEARAAQAESEKALRAKDATIDDLQAQLDELKALAARAAEGDKKAVAEMAKIIAAAKVAEDKKPVTKVVPPAPAESAPQS